VRRDYGELGCYSDVMLELQSTCSGRRSCHVQVDNVTFSRVTPCPRELQSYLNVNYRCTKGSTRDIGHSAELLNVIYSDLKSHLSVNYR